MKRDTTTTLFAALILSMSATQAPLQAEQAQAPLTGRVTERNGPSRVNRPSLPTPTPQSSTSVPLSADQFVIDHKMPASVSSGADDPWKQLTPLNVIRGETNPKVMQSLTPARRPVHGGLNAAMPRMLPGDHANPTNVQAQLKLIEPYQVVILLDSSGSMAIPDCNGISRWNWCREEMSKFSTQTSKILPEGFDVILFSWMHQDQGKRKLNEIDQVFEMNKPNGATIMTGALKSCFDRYANTQALGNDKRLLVAIISDGAPQDEDEVEAQIVAMTRRIKKPDQVVMTFLRVGHEDEGDRFVKWLDDNLTARGAAYDIVDSEDFMELQRNGLLNALSRAVSKTRGH